VIQAGPPDAQPEQLVDGLQSANWRALVPAGQNSLGFWLKMMFGAPTTTGTAPNYVHSFRTNAAPVIPAFTAQEYYSTINRRFLSYGCFANRMEIDVQRRGQRAKLEFSGQAIKWDKEAEIADDDPLEYAAAGDTAPLEYLCDIYLTEAGGSAEQKIGVVTGIRYTIENEMQLDQAAFNGTALASERTGSKWNVSGSVQMRLKDYEWTDLARNRTECVLEARLVTGANNRLNLIASGVKFDSFAPQATTAGEILMTANFRCQKPASGFTFIARLDNQLANYNRPT